jgi:hypothetical protein
VFVAAVGVAGFHFNTKRQRPDPPIVLGTETGPVETAQTLTLW